MVSSLLLTAMYMFSGIEKFTKLQKVASGLRKRTFPSVPLPYFVVALTFSSTMLVVTSIIINVAAAKVATLRASPRLARWAKYACYYLIGFTVLATLIYHYPPTGATYYPFISNVTAVGGLLLLSGSF